MLDKKYRGKGYGELITKKGLDHFKKRNVKKITITTWSTNIPVINMIKKIGFIQFKTVKDERRNGVDGLYFILQETQGS